MILIDFFFENLHFALNIFVSFVFFAVAWLFLDAWLQTKRKKDIPKIAGFIFLSFSFLIHATQIQQVSFTGIFLDQNLIDIIANILKVAGYSLLVVGFLIDPIQEKPKYSSSASESDKSPDLSKKDEKGQFLIAPIIPVVSIHGIWYILSPILSFTLFILLLRRSTKGLERHMLPLTIGFFFIFLFELVSVSELLKDTASISVYQIVQPLGPLWIITHLFLLIGTIVIAKWVFGYLLKRIQTQFFMILNIMVIIIFLITTVTFTSLLLNSFRDSAISHLTTDVKVVQYAITAKQEETLSDSEVVAQNPEIISAIRNKDRRVLNELSTSILLAKGESYLIVLDNEGRVLARGENNEKSGDSLSGDPVFQKAINGEKTSSVVVRQGPLSPVVSIRSSSSVGSASGQLGVVIVGTDIDNAFVDGLKNSTGLDVSVYGGNILSATTFVGPDGKSRFIGIRENNENINRKVLNEGKNYSGEVSILNVPHIVSYAPLTDLDKNPIGMLFVGEEQISIIKAASKSIQFTFIIAVLFILISIIPSYIISKYITKQYS